MRYLVITFLSLITMVLFFQSSAQKLPNVQTVALRAPANIKIDGKMDEWGSKMQAYNKSTGVFYTVANDDANLYLAVQAADHDIIHKITSGGIVLNINPSGKSFDKGAVAITFPAYGDKVTSLSLTLIMNNRPILLTDPDKNKIRVDSFYNAKNQAISQHFKLIKQNGIKALADTLMSVYNEDGIKAAAYLDHQDVYGYELAIPLKYLNIDKGGTAKFNYNLKLNGIAYYAVRIEEPRPGYFSMLGGDGKYYMIGSPTMNNSQMYPTDFWGEYTLAKKP